MDTPTLIRRAALGLLAFSLVACGGSSPSDAAGDAAVDAPAGMATSAAADPAADPNDPAGVGAIVHEEEVPVPGTTLGACEIITTADIKAAFGFSGTVADGVFEASPTVLSPGHTECAYEGDFGRVLVSLTPEDGANLYDAAYGAYDGLEVIPGLGDGAFWAADTNRGFVWQDRVTAMISVYAADGDVEEIELVTSLGQALIAKL
jgi:hypothetical protein